MGCTDARGRLKGLDICQWQGYIDFEKVREAGIAGIYIRTGEGIGFVDPFFESHYHGCVRAGIKIGFVHGVTARSVSQAVTEACAFLSIVYGRACEGRLMADVEDLEELADWRGCEIAEAFLRTVELHGNRRAGIRCGAEMAERLRRLEERYPLWIVRHGVDEPGTAWGGGLAGWQYTAQGRVDGVQGLVCRDKFLPELFWEGRRMVRKMGEFPSERAEAVPYRVRAGDSLASIAAKFHVGVEELKRQNRLKNPILIYPGQMLLVAVNPRERWEERYEYHRVERGDTLYAMAQKYNTSLPELQRLNGIVDPAALWPGQVVKIRRKK